MAEVLNITIDDSLLDKGMHKVDVSNFATDEDDDQIITLTDGADISDLKITKLGKDDDEPDEIHIDLTTFDDDFSITVKSEGSEDTFFITKGAGDTYSIDGSGVLTLNYTGSDGLPHVLTLDPGVAQIVIVCFVRGTRIETDQGEVSIEDLAAGDMVKTLDHGPQPILWIGSNTVPAIGRVAPIRIKAGALGNTRDLLVSPQHRMMLTGWQLELFFANNEVLATAKSLLNDQTIVRQEGGRVEYFHMLFDTHEIVFAEGAPSESFHPGQQAMDGFADETRAEIIRLFPRLLTDINSYGPAARTSLKAYEAQVAAAEMGISADMAKARFL